jgi:hypothetical protein
MYFSHSIEYEEYAACVLWHISYLTYYRLPGSDRFFQTNAYGGLTKSKVIAFYRAKNRESSVMRDVSFG